MDTAEPASQTGLVAMAATRMRAMVLAQEPGSQLGSLPEIAKAVGVGLVTIRQAARLLEHEGLLQVRRGNGGGFYAARPNSAALGRAIAGYLQGNPAQEREAIEIMTLLDCDLMAAAALSTDEHLRDRLQEQAERIDLCDTPELRAAFVAEMHEIVFRMADRPLMEMMVRMAMQHHAMHSRIAIYSGAEETARWKQERHSIVAAILRRDPVLARFEAQRRRDYVLERISGAGAA